MPTEEDKKEFNLLSDYAFSLASYQGEGFLTSRNQKNFSCHFEVGQLKTGDIFLICNLPSLDIFPLLVTEKYIEHFNGVTTEGFHLSTKGNVLWTRFSKNVLTCRLQELSVERIKDIPPHTVHFGITNFIFEEGFSPCLEHNNKKITVQIKPVEEYRNIMERIRNLQSIDVTCEIIVHLAEFMDITSVEQMLSNLCYLLSVAEGTKIQWIYQDYYDKNGLCLSRVHESRVAKVYSPLSVLKSRNIQAFLEGTYSIYVANHKRYQFDTRTIDTYLDAKAENDYLQVRGIKLAVAMEVIKDIFTDLAENPVQEFMVDKNKFKKIIRTLKDAIYPILQNAKINITEKTLGEKLQDLNRKAFRDLLNDIFKRVNLQINDEDMMHFVRCRNSLVHRGRFYCETVRQEPPGHEEITQEYYFLVNILDKLLLKLLKYHGPYWDRRLPQQPIYKDCDLGN